MNNSVGLKMHKIQYDYCINGAKSIQIEQYITI